MTERRFESRYLCADLVRVDWLVAEACLTGSGESDATHTTHALLEDISALGACVQAELPIAIGSTVALTIGDALFSGHVCYCVYRDYGFFVGIRFSPATEWSSATVVPQHLTCLDGFTAQLGGN